MPMIVGIRDRFVKRATLGRVAADLRGFRKWLLRRGRSQQTQDHYERVMRRLLRLDDVLERVMNRGYSPYYRRNMVAVLRQWARYKKDDELKERLEKDNLRLPAALRQNPRLPCDSDEWFSIREAVDEGKILSDPMRSVVGIILARGIRCSDVLRLERREILTGVKTGVLPYEGKGGRRHEPSAEEFLHYLQALLEEDWRHKSQLWEVVSPGASKIESAARQVRKKIDKLAKHLGYEPAELFCHRFRHTYVNRFLEATENDPRAPFLLQDQMGWASLNTARSYVKHGERGELDAIEKKMFSRKRRPR